MPLWPSWLTGKCLRPRPVIDGPHPAPRTAAMFGSSFNLHRRLRSVDVDVVFIHPACGFRSSGAPDVENYLHLHLHSRGRNRVQPPCLQPTAIYTNMYKYASSTIKNLQCYNKTHFDLTYTYGTMVRYAVVMVAYVLVVYLDRIHIAKKGSGSGSIRLVQPQ